MSPREKELKIQQEKQEDLIKQIYTLIRTGEWNDNLARFNKKVIIAYKMVTDDGKTSLLNILKTLVKETKLTTIEVLFIQDIVNVLVIKTPEDFTKYLEVIDVKEDETEKVYKHREIHIPTPEVGFYTTQSQANEFVEIANILGLVQTAYMLTLLYNIKTR